MAELFRSYHAAVETRKQSYALMRWGPIADFWRARLLSTVGTDTFREFFAWRRKHRPVKNHTLHKDVVLIRQVLKYAIEQDMITQLPRIPSVGTIETNPRPWLTPQEGLHLLSVAIGRIKTAPNKRVKERREAVLDMMTFLDASMLRIGELRTLHFHSCRLGKNTDGDPMLLCEVTGKRGTRTIVAQQPAAEVYERRLKNAQPQALIFPKHCRDGFRELLEAAGLRTDARGFTRNLKSMRATSIGHQHHAVGESRNQSDHRGAERWHQNRHD